MHRNDIYWKGLIEDLFPHFIPFFLPKYQQLFDPDQPVEFLDKELNELFPETAEPQTRLVDKLVKVFTAAGQEKWVLIHIEVQGYSDPDFSERMFGYFNSIYEKYRKPVTAIAIFTEGSRSFCPDHYVYDFAGVKLIYQFNIYKVLRQNEKQLGESDNPFAIAILTVLLALKRKKLADESLLKLKVVLTRQLYTKGFSKKIARQLFNFISNYVNFAKPETAVKFEEATKVFTPNNQPMGLEEQILEMKKLEGRQEEKSSIVESLLRSTDFSDEKIAGLVAAPITLIAEIREKLSH